MKLGWCQVLTSIGCFNRSLPCHFPSPWHVGNGQSTRRRQTKWTSVTVTGTTADNGEHWKWDDEPRERAIAVGLEKNPGASFLVSLVLLSRSFLRVVGLSLALLTPFLLPYGSSGASGEEGRRSEWHEVREDTKGTEVKRKRTAGCTHVNDWKW